MQISGCAGAFDSSPCPASEIETDTTHLRRLVKNLFPIYFEHRSQVAELLGKRASNQVARSIPGYAK